MSWKGDSLDYSNYHHGGGGSTSPVRSQQSLYPSDGLGNGSSSAGLGDYRSTYSGRPSFSSPLSLLFPSYYLFDSSRVHILIKLTI